MSRTIGIAATIKCINVHVNVPTLHTLPHNHPQFSNTDLSHWQFNIATAWYIFLQSHVLCCTVFDCFEMLTVFRCWDLSGGDPEECEAEQQCQGQQGPTAGEGPPVAGGDHRVIQWSAWQQCQRRKPQNLRGWGGNFEDQILAWKLFSKFSADLCGIVNQKRHECFWRNSFLQRLFEFL